MEYLFDALRGGPFPARAGDQIAARIVAGGAASDVAVIVGVAVDQLHGVVAILLNLRDGDHDGFGSQIQPEHGIGRVAVRRDHGGVLVGEHAGFIADLVERTLVLPGILIHAELVHDRVVHHDRQTVDEAFLGDGLGFLDGGSGDAGCLVSLFRFGDGVALFPTTGESRAGDGARERQMDNSVFGYFHGFQVDVPLPNAARIGCLHVILCVVATSPPRLTLFRLRLSSCLPPAS